MLKANDSLNDARLGCPFRRYSLWMLMVYNMLESQTLMPRDALIPWLYRESVTQPRYAFASAVRHGINRSRVMVHVCTATEFGRSPLTLLAACFA